MRWEDPPNGQGQRKFDRWEAEASELRNHPGRWALIKEYPVTNRNRAAGFANAIRSGRYIAFRPAASFEATEHTTDEVSQVFARYIGEN